MRKFRGWGEEPGKKGQWAEACLAEVWAQWSGRVCASLPESVMICTEAFLLNKKQTRHLMMIIVTYIY